MNLWRITSDDSWESPSKPDGYRSRYRAFLQQNSNDQSAPLQNLTQIGQGLMSVAIFVVLFIVILILLGMGLSWYNQTILPRSEATSPKRATSPDATLNALTSPSSRYAGRPAGPTHPRNKTRRSTAATVDK